MNTYKLYRVNFEDLRELAKRGQGFLTREEALRIKEQKQYIDYYRQLDGDKKYDRITKVTSTGYTIGGDTFRFK